MPVLSCAYDAHSGDRYRHGHAGHPPLRLRSADRERASTDHAVPHADCRRAHPARDNWRAAGPPDRRDRRGRTMSLGARRPPRAGGRAFATAEAATTFDDDLENVEQMGVKLVSEDEAQSLDA